MPALSGRHFWREVLCGCKHSVEVGLCLRFEFLQHPLIAVDREPVVERLQKSVAPCVEGLIREMLEFLPVGPRVSIELLCRLGKRQKVDVEHQEAVRMVVEVLFLVRGCADSCRYK